MRRLLLAIALAYAVAPAADAEATSDPLMVPVLQFVNGFNNGDTKSAIAAFVPDGLAIIDDIAPHVWTGPKAIATWARDLTASESVAGITNGKVTLGAPIREVGDATHAYLVVPSAYHFVQGGTRSTRSRA